MAALLGRIGRGSLACRARLAHVGPADAALDAALRQRFETLTDLADGGLGGMPLFATDEWFATCDNLIKNGAPVFDPEAFCTEGKVSTWPKRCENTRIKGPL
ncbi:hypothetical protein T492DRAFT_882621 [Pavlovales sp. CCMP2436]|nr:hypothetical protein T492DRAFT_882621 [Pavlovales sp. CCMP2436]